MGSIANKIQESGLIIAQLGSIGFIGLVFLIIFGNLGGNTGFAAGSQGANDTSTVINNITAGYKTFFGFSPTLFTAAAIVLLITMFVGLLLLVVGVVKKLTTKSSGGFGGGEY